MATGVSQKRKLLPYTKLSDALKHFDDPVSQASVAAEAEFLAAPANAVMCLAPSVQGQTDHDSETNHRA